MTNNMTLNIVVQSPKSTHHSLFSVNNLKRRFKGTKGISASRMISTSRFLERNEMDYSECLVRIDRVLSGPGGSRWSMGHASIFLKCHASGRPRFCLEKWACISLDGGPAENRARVDNFSVTLFMHTLYIEEHTNHSVSSRKVHQSLILQLSLP